jgi:hypothetical protein
VDSGRRAVRRWHRYRRGVRRGPDVHRRDLGPPPPRPVSGN